MEPGTHHLRARGFGGLLRLGCLGTGVRYRNGRRHKGLFTAGAVGCGGIDGKQLLVSPQFRCQLLRRDRVWPPWIRPDRLRRKRSCCWR